MIVLLRIWVVCAFVCMDVDDKKIACLGRIIVVDSFECQLLNSESDFP